MWKSLSESLWDVSSAGVSERGINETNITSGRPLATGRGGAPAAWEAVLCVSGPGGGGPCLLLERPMPWFSGSGLVSRGRWAGHGHCRGTCVISDSLHPCFLGFGGGGGVGGGGWVKGCSLDHQAPLRAGLWTCRRCCFQFSHSPINKVKGTSGIILFIF